MNLYDRDLWKSDRGLGTPQNDGINIAYQVVGDGDLDLLLIDTWVHHVEAVWDFPDFALFLRRLSIGT